MKKRRKAGAFGRFDVLEDRVVMSTASRPVLVNNDVQAFFANYAATVPAMVANWDTLHQTAKQTMSPMDIAAAQAANANIRAAITQDVNVLAYNLWNSLGSSSFATIRLSVTGVSSAAYTIYSTGTANPGSLLASLLAVENANPNALGGQSGLNFAADVSIATAYSVSIGTPILPFGPFGTYSSTIYTDLQPLASQLAMEKANASNPPTTDQQMAIDASIASIDNVIVRDTNGLGTALVTKLGRAATQGIGQVITGVNSSTSVIFTPMPGAQAAYGSLMATYLSLDNFGEVLEDPNVTIALVTQFAFI